MNFYTCQDLREICKEHSILCSRLTKEEMYNLLCSEGFITKVPSNSPLPNNRRGEKIECLETNTYLSYKETYTNLASNNLKTKDETWYLGEEKYEI